MLGKGLSKADTEEVDVEGTIAGTAGENLPVHLNPVFEHTPDLYK